MRIEEIYSLFLNGDGISTDTRNLKPNTIFFALKGDNFNGNEFGEKAIEEGCSYAIVDEKNYDNDQCILVEDVLLTLQNLANHHRKQFKIPVLAITGSNGKTTTKELIAAVLTQKYNVLFTEGNLNNHLGVPFTLLRINESHEFAIIEMGANKPGDIRELVEIAEPTHGIITNIGAAHIEGFGSIEGVIQTKTELYEYLNANKGCVFYNEDDEILVGNLPKDVSLYTYGEKQGQIQGKLLAMDPFVSFEWGDQNVTSKPITTNLVGRYNFINFLAAVSIGTYFKVEPQNINKALANYNPSNNRSQIEKTERNTLIVDCYNANATSMKAALDSFNDIEGDNKMAILGDMLELGDISNEEHQKIISILIEYKINALLVGEVFCSIPSEFKSYKNYKDLKSDQQLDKYSDRLILLKGSRGIRLEELIPFL
jgi:UDP-N-acetylmuramoyl-tripeptide--D-alanyl-D-alanine ligase